MQNLLYKLGKMIAFLALKVGIACGNSVCTYWMYQPKEPEGMKKYKK